MDAFRSVAGSAASWVKDNPKKSVTIAVSSLVGVVPGVVIVPVLGSLGFTAGGVAAGSVAARMQAAIGNVVARSLFAFGQSAAAGGAAAGTVATAGGVTAGATAGYTLIKDGWSWLKDNPAFSSQVGEKKGECA